MKKHYHKAIYFDVDETLIFWEEQDSIRCSNSPQYTGDNWYLGTGRGFIKIDAITYKVHVYHLDRIEQHHNNGDLVVVWSAGGKGWADRVVDALGVRKYVDIVLPKPDYYYDDIELKDFSSKRMFFDHETLKFKR